MSSADAVAAVLWIGVTAYAVFGGADFGAGFWSLIAGGSKQGTRARELADWAIGPVWEANHVWLIFALVVLWTGFSSAFEAVFSTLFIPLSLAAFGIVLRGSGFAFHKTARRTGGRNAAERLFGLSSLFTPFFMGCVVGAVAAGKVPVGNAAGDPWSSWVNPVSLVIGALFVATSAYLASVFLVSDARRAGAPDLEHYFTTRALVAAVVAGALAVGGLFALHADARYVYDGLTNEGLPLVIVSAVCGIAVLVLLRRGAHRGARPLAIAAVAAIVWGWGIAQHPYLLPTDLTISQAAAPSSTLTEVLIVFGVAVLLVIPSIALLYSLAQRGLVEESLMPGSAGTTAAAAPMPTTGAAGAPAGERRHQVVIVGGGFGGLFAAKFLRRAAVDVTLVDRTNHHLFQPLLYQLATGILSEGAIAPPLRQVLRKHQNVTVALGNVTTLDLERRTVTADRPMDAPFELHYDSLIVATGATGSYFGHDEYALVAPGLKTVDDALELRARIFGAFEMAEMEEDAATQRAWLTFAVVGGGPTGVEMAGQITELAHRALRGNFRRIDPATVRVLLFDAGDAVLATFGNELSAKAEHALNRIHVEVRTKTRVTGMSYRDITVEGPDGSDTISCHVKVWAAGVTASPLARVLGDATGAEVDRAGRIAVQPDCSLPGHPEVFAIGDMMSLNKLPGVAEVAMQSGIHAAETIKRRVKNGGESKPFKYRDLGSMASIARFSAVVDFKGIRISGFPGWLMWVVVHVTFLTGFKNRFTALVKWVTTFVGRSRDERTISMLQGSARVIAAEAHIRPGEEELTELVARPASPKPE